MLQLELSSDYPMIILVIVCTMVAAERLSELISSSIIFETLLFKQQLKNYLFNPDGPPPKGTAFRRILVLLDKLLSCGYCISVWVGLMFSTYYLYAGTLEPLVKYIGGSEFFAWLLIGLAIHGVSNGYHVLYEVMRRGRVRTHDYKVDLNITEVFDGSSGQSNSQKQIENGA